MAPRRRVANMAGSSHTFRRVSTSPLLSRANTSEMETNSAFGSSEKMPIGTLTKTVVHSPEIKWAFEAQIRNAAHSDVVFVRDQRLVVLFAFDSRVLERVEFVTFQHALPPCTSEPMGRLGEHLAVEPQ